MILDLLRKRIGVREMHKANRKRWDLASPHYGTWQDDGRCRCLADPSLGFERGSIQLLRQHMGGGLAGKAACVLGSGDNYAVFALAGMGGTDHLGGYLPGASGWSSPISTVVPRRGWTIQRLVGRSWPLRHLLIPECALRRGRDYGRR